MDTVADTTIHPTAKTAATTKRSTDWSVNLNEFLRCMDPDVIVLFDQDLVLKYPLPDESIGKSLGLMEFKYVSKNISFLSEKKSYVFSLYRFLIEDLTQKVESIFGVRKFGNTVDSCQSIAYPAEFISDVVDILPKILNHFAQVTKQLKQTIDNSKSSEAEDDNDTEMDACSEDLFSNEANLMKVCFGLCIRMLAALFTWPEFDDDANNNTLTSKTILYICLLTFQNNRFKIAI